MQIRLNGEPVATDARTLDELCAKLGFAEARIATAVNGSFIAATKRGVKCRILMDAVGSKQALKRPLPEAVATARAPGLTQQCRAAAGRLSAAAEWWPSCAQRYSGIDE